MDGVSERFDEKLFELKMGQVFPETYGLAFDDTPLREVLTVQESGEEASRGSLEARFLDRYLAVLGEQLRVMDCIAREVWRAQGEAITPHFVREILFPKATNLIDAWLKRHNHVSITRDTQGRYPALFRQVAVVEVPKLRKELNTRYEIEARELEHRKAVVEKQAKPNADEWRDFRDGFRALADEEHAIVQSSAKDSYLRAYCDYKKDPEVWERGKPEQGLMCLVRTPETGLWIVSHGVNENFQERFRAFAARAGVALGSPDGTDREDFWLHGLYLDLMENNSGQLFAASNEGGVILRLCEASATFCSRLERKALAESSSVQHNTKSTQDMGVKSTNAAAGRLTHTEDYRTVVIRGENYTLTPRQAQMIQILHEAHEDGTPDVASDNILERLETPNSRWQDTWKTSKEAQNALIQSGTRKGTLRLKL